MYCFFSNCASLPAFFFFFYPTNAQRPSPLSPFTSFPFVALLRQPFSPPSILRQLDCRSLCALTTTPAFLRLLARGDVFSVKTVASALGSGREGARGAPVFEENTSAKGSRASKQQIASEPQNSTPLVPIPAYFCLKRPILANKFAYIKNFSYLCTRF